MNKDLHLRVNTVEELRKRIQLLNDVITNAAYHLLKEEPYSALDCLRNARLWRNGENPFGEKSYPIDDNEDYDGEDNDDDENDEENDDDSTDSSK